jgi:integrase/recombinase XerC/integrase/recombinase XerD
MNHSAEGSLHVIGGREALASADLAQLRVGYLRHLERRGRAEKTIESNARALMSFATFVGDRVIDRELLARWQDAQGEVRAATRAVRFSMIRSFLRWAASQEMLNPSLWLSVETIRIPRQLPKPIPHADLERVLQYLYRLPAELDRRGALRIEIERALRTRALFFFLFSTGARIFEALQVNRHDYADGQVRVIQKGGGEKLLITTQAAKEAIEAYLEVRTDHHEAMFLAYQANQPATRLSAGGAGGIWQRLAGQLGIRSFGNHRIRHSTATELGEANVLDSVVQTQMGHSSPSSTAGYRQIRVGRRRQVVEEALGPLMAAKPDDRKQYLAPLLRPGRRGRTIAVGAVE